MTLVSACLAGFPCRYDGRAKPDEDVIALVKAGKAIPVCPEQLGGLETPREPSEIVEGRALSRDGRDLTDSFLRGARICLEVARQYECRAAILKAKSPSCGVGIVYDGGFSGRTVPGDGFAAALLRSEGLSLATEEGPERP